MAHAFGELEDRQIADATVFVHDEVLNIDRRIVAGQPVPYDLTAAYANARSAKAKTPAKAVKGKSEDESKDDE